MSPSTLLIILYSSFDVYFFARSTASLIETETGISKKYISFIERNIIDFATLLMLEYLADRLSSSFATISS